MLHCYSMFTLTVPCLLSNQSLDQERKERLLAKLREIDLNGQSDTVHRERVRSPRRYSMESAHLYALRTKSPVRRPNQGTYNLFESLATSDPGTPLMSASGPYGRRTASDTFPRSNVRRNSQLDNLQEVETPETSPSARYEKQNLVDIFGSSNLRPGRTLKASARSTGFGLTGDSIFPELRSSSVMQSSQSLFPWEQKTNF